MPKTKRLAVPLKPAEIDALIDTIKDEIDRLHEISGPKRKLEAAKDLVDYITLHHIEYPE